MEEWWLGGWWTGGHDIAREADWKWISSCQPVGDFIWYSEPDIDIGYDCLYLAYGYYIDWFGGDMSCDRNYYHICQIKN